VRERAERSGRRGIRGAMPDQHRAFFMQLPFLLVGSLDAQDRPWASALVGRPGFIDSPDAETLAIAARPAADDPLAAALAVGAPLGLLGIEPATRRRNHMNDAIAVGGAASRCMSIRASATARSTSGAHAGLRRRERAGAAAAAESAPVGRAQALIRRFDVLLHAAQHRAPRPASTSRIAAASRASCA
jgi:predicted pyridoxine 5'-phosphate oxidase superfamily flavin-nucleotide-binding protein